MNEKRYALPGPRPITRATGLNQSEADIVNSNRARTGRNEIFHLAARGDGHVRIRLPGLLLILFIAGIAGAGHPLEPLDTSSPRATLESFLVVTDEADGIVARLRRELGDVD